MSSANGASIRTLVSGFLAFEGFPVNPSALLAANCGRRFELIEVAYESVDEFVGALDTTSFDRLLMLGVAGRSSCMRVERIARNVVGARSDVRGAARAPGPIEPNAPAQLSGTLWTSPAWSTESGDWRPSDDAGEYLCNYIYWRALRQFTKKAIGFLHVPPTEQMDLARQQRALGQILDRLESAAQVAEMTLS